MVQIADAVGVHETTVSRAISGKYMATPHGVFDMKYFFTPGYQTAGGESMSNTSVKGAIAELVKAEDTKNPLSDKEIVEILEQARHPDRPPHRREIPQRAEHPAEQHAESLLRTAAALTLLILYGLSRRTFHARALVAASAWQQTVSSSADDRSCSSRLAGTVSCARRCRLRLPESCRACAGSAGMADRGRWNAPRTARSDR